MTPEQKLLVQQSFAKVAPIADQAAEIFYGRLFAIAPQVRPMFKGDMTQQGAKLMKTLALAVNGLDRLEELVPVLEKLGRDHVPYGVEEGHYALVGEALLWTLEQGLGDDFTAETREAWSVAYQTLAGVMINAAYTQPEAKPATGFMGKLKSMFA